jgi:membrane-bound metal-dependent hydrolase YbcI (DUF457 family)
MRGSNHLALALAGALTVSSPGSDYTSWAAFLLGSLAPDIDGHGYISHPGAFMPRLVPHFIRDLADAIGHAVSDLVSGVFGHRGAFHYPVWYVLMIIAGQRWGVVWLAWLGVGCLVHLAGDLITKSGIPLFGPIWRRDIALPPYVKTGGAGEALIGVAIWGVITWQGWQHIQSVPAGKTALRTLEGFFNAWIH